MKKEEINKISRMLYDRLFPPDKMLGLIIENEVITSERETFKVKIDTVEILDIIRNSLIKSYKEYKKEKKI